MKKAMCFIAALLLSAVAFAQYPNFIYGDDMLATPGPFDVEAYIAQYVDHNPWSMPSPEGAQFFFGRVCFNDDGAQIHFDSWAVRHCEASPWHVPGEEEVCSAFWCRAMLYPTIYVPWDAEAGAYVYTFQGVSGTHFYALSCSAEQEECILYQGLFDVFGGEYVVSDGYTFEAWKINLRDHECVSPPIKVMGRVGKR